MSDNEIARLHDLDRDSYERLLSRALHDVREHLDERISREQLERVLLASEAHPYDVLEAIQHLALIVGADQPCPHCGDFDCAEQHEASSVTIRLAQCGSCGERFPVYDRSVALDAGALPLNQCGTCARVEARGGPERLSAQLDWQPDDRVELLEWLPSDRVFLTGA